MLLTVTAVAAGTTSLSPESVATDAKRPRDLDPTHLIGPVTPDVRRLGESVAADGGLAVVTAPTDGDDAHMPGRAEVLRLSRDSVGAIRVQREQTLFARPQSIGDHFGSSVAVLERCPDAANASLIAVGADRATVGDAAVGVMAGAVDVFEGPSERGRSWRMTARLSAASPEPGASFGAALSFDRTGSARLAIGAPRHDANDLFDVGRVHIFRRLAPPTGTLHPSRWTEVASLAPPTPRMSMWFGASVALDGDLLAIGSPGDDVAPADTEDTVHGAGAVYLYRRAATVPTSEVEFYQLERILTAPTAEHAAWFGLAIALERDTLAVGVPRARDQSIESAPIGCVYIFDLGHPETQPKRIDPPSTIQTQGFGQALALRDRVLAIGAPSTDRSDPLGSRGTIEDAGAAWIYALAHGSYSASLVPPIRLPSGLFGVSCALTEIPSAYQRLSSAHATHPSSPNRSVAVAIVGHLFLEEESIASSPGAAIYELPRHNPPP